MARSLKRSMRITENTGLKKLKAYKRPRTYLFTDRKISFKSAVSVVLGSVALVSAAAALVMTYRAGGTAKIQYGAVVLLCLFFSMAGLILAIYGRREPDTLHLPAYVGMGINIAVLALCTAVLYYGVQ